ncbi:MAG: hypothetical protein U5Q44_15865 [Dehalococcoidia bacterium]|nr:hypothetical protein [Dehalococcoidia bacterium]
MSRPPPVTLLAMGAVIERFRVQEMDLRRQYPAAFRRVRGKAWKRFRRRLKQRRKAVRKH